MEDKIALLGMTLAELKAVAGEIGMPSFAARQMAEWLYGKKVASIDEMTNISAKNRRLLNERYTVGCAAPVDGQRSADGTVKYLYRTAAGGERAKRFIFPVNQIRNLVFLRNPCTPFAAVAGNKAFSVREPQNLQIAMCRAAVAGGILCAIGEGV